MATIKSYTDLGQSKKLAEFLPIESADMCWTNHCYGSLRSSITISAKSIDEYKNLLKNFADLTEIDVFYPAWSLAALLSVIRKTIGYTIYGVNDVYISCELGDKPWQVETQTYDNEVDAAYEMIIKLHKQNIL
jgi:hypothetical protein